MISQFEELKSRLRIFGCEPDTGNAYHDAAEAIESLERQLVGRDVLISEQNKLAKERQEWALHTSDVIRQKNEQLAAVTAQRDLLKTAMENIQKCDFAARVEGLVERLAESSNEVGSLRDLVERRLLHMTNYADEAIASLKGE